MTYRQYKAKKALHNILPIDTFKEMELERIRQCTKISRKIKTIDIEVALAYYFDYRRNLIVPNVSWGLHTHECDMFIMSKSGYATEVEIKISRADLKKDSEKRHGHASNKIKQLYFAIPPHLLPDIEYIPERAGILIVYYKEHALYPTVYKLRDAVTNNTYKYSPNEISKLARLGTLRIWSLKQKLIKTRIKNETQNKK